MLCESPGRFERPGDASLFGDPSSGVLGALAELSRNYLIQRYDLEESEGQVRVFVGPMRPAATTVLMTDLRRRLPDCQLSFVNLEGRL